MNNILENIKAIRLEKSVKQSVMADYLSVTQAGYSAWENGSRELTYNNLLKIGEILDVSVIDIITYPKKYVDSSTINASERISITFEVSPDKRDYLLKLVTGDKE